MSVTSSVPYVVVLYLQLWGAYTLPPAPTCLIPCLCQRTALLNCSSSGLSKAPARIPATATGLDLSHNAIQSLFPLWSGHNRLRGLQHFWVGDNALESLSMCLGKSVESTKNLTGSKERCVSWAPDLQLLSAERNQLKQIPRGLCSVKSLQVLLLSYNKISELGPADLAGCTHLKAVHLQHNFINIIHPQAFKELSSLQVLDLSFNLLTTIPLPAYLSLRNFNTLVAISGNRWRCDCNVKTIRRWLSFDQALSKPEWKMVCFSPAHHAGKDLLDLEESDLTCPPPIYSTPGFQKEMTVDEGTELLLSCAIITKDSSDFLESQWWTPHGKVSENQQVLFISNITEQHAGLYVCVSGFQEKHVSIFNLHVRKRVHNARLPREAQNVLDELTREDNMNIQRNVRAVTQSNFVLAVCLSVFITFIVAFILGVVLRPFLDKLCKRIRTKRDSSTTSTNHRTSTTEPNPYVNEGYSDPDDHVHEVRMGSRVTFGGVTEVNDCGGNVPYYVTVEEGKLDTSSENNTDVSYDDTLGREYSINNVETQCLEMEELEHKKSSIPSSSLQVTKEVSLREANAKASDPQSIYEYPDDERSKVMEFEPIPDPGDITELEDRSISPASSYSGLPQKLESCCEVKESIEQSVDSPVVTIHEEKESSTGQQAIKLQFVIDPFSEKEECVDDLDPELWNDSGESFSFTDDSPRSSSRVAVLDYALVEKEMSVDKMSDKLSSCNSSESGLTDREQSLYTVNPEEDEKSEVLNNPKSGNDGLIKKWLPTPEQDALHVETSTGVRQDIHPSDAHETFDRGDSFDDEPFPIQHEPSGSSNIQTDEEGPRQYHVHPVYRTSQMTGHLMTDRSVACNSSEGEEKPVGKTDHPERIQITTEPEVNRAITIPVKNLNNTININFDNSSSSTDIEEKTNAEGERKSIKRLSLLSNQMGAETEENAVQSKTSKTNSDTSEESFFGTLGQAFNQLPKLKKALLFTATNPQTPIQYGSTPIAKAGCDSPIPNSSSEESFFQKINLALDSMPKIKRYLHFSQSEAQPPVKCPSTPLEAERVTQKRYGIPELSEDELSPICDAGFFEQIHPYVNGLPKLKRYIQFTKTEAQSSAHLVFETETQPEKSYSSSDNKHIQMHGGDSLNEQISPSVEKVPKVRRYIQFTLPTTLPSAECPLTPVKTKMVTPEFESKIHSLTSVSSTKNEFSPASEEDSFFSQISPSLDGVSKVKRYIQFTKSEPHTSSLLPPSMTERITPELETKTQNTTSASSSELIFSPTNERENFFVQIGTALNGLPKVNRYIKFIQSESQPSNELSSFPLKTESVTPLLGGKLKPTKNEASPTLKEGRFSNQISTFAGVPKVKRYLKFVQSESQLSARSPSKTLKVEKVLGTKTQSMRSDSSFEHELTPAFEGDGLFTQIDMSLDEMPKVKRYIQFKHSEPQDLHEWSSAPLNIEVPSVVLTKTQTVRSDLKPEDELSSASEGDNFYEQANTTLKQVPKVTRYIRFTQSEPTFLAQSTPLSEKYDSALEVEPKTKDYNFFEQISASLNEVPKVKRYVHFTQSEPSISTPTSLNAEKIPPVGSMFENEYGPGTTGYMCLEQVDVPFVKVPKMKRYIQFTQSELQTSAQSTTSWITPKLETKVQSKQCDSSSEVELSPPIKGENFLRQTSTSLNGVPKVKRYIQFTQSEPQPQGLLQLSKKTQIITPNEDSMAYESSSEDKITRDSFFGQTATSLNAVPKMKRYIQFSQLKPQSDASFKNKPDPTSKRDHFFEQINITLDRVPNVKTYIKFTKYEPVSQIPSETETIHKGTETIRNNSSSEDRVRADAEKHGFFGQIDTFLDGIPKVKKYIEFTQSGSIRSAQPAELYLDRQMATPELLTKPKLERIQDVNSINEDNFFGKTDSSLCEIPKVKRYIQFTQYESPASGFSSGNEAKPSSNKDHFFEGMYISFDYLQKVKRYIQFSQTEFYPPNRSSTVNTQRVMITAEDDTNPASEEDCFIKNVAPSVNKIPKLKRYLKFTHPPLSAQSSSLQTERVTESGSSEEEEFSTTKKGESFLPIGTRSLDRVPKVKRFIQFTLSEPQIPSHSSNKINAESKLSSLAYQHENVVDRSFFKQISASFDQIPKVKRYVHFTHTEPYPQILDFRFKPHFQTPTSHISDGRAGSTDSEVNGQSFSSTLSTESNSFSLYKLPKPTRSLQFSTPKPRTLDADVPPQDANQVIKETPPNSPVNDEAREYLRDSSQARQRQERRRLLFHQKRRAMDGFSLTSQDSDKQGLSDHSKDTVTPYSERSVSSRSADTASHNVSFEGLTAKRISSLKYKSALHPGTYKSFSDV